MQKNYLITRILILLSLPFNIGFCHLAYSQDVVLSELSLGTATTTSLPILGNYGYSYSQMLYFKSDMNEQVQGANSLITKVRFYYNAGSVSQSKDWVIYMGHTTINSFTSATSWVPLTNLIKVFSGDISVLTPEQGGWFEIELQTPFPYNGISNLVLAVDENTPGFYNLSFRQHSGTSANRSILYRNDTNNPNPDAPPSSSSRYDYVPQTIFVHEPADLCSGTPAHAGITVTPASICQGETATISYLQPDVLEGLEYVWQTYDGTSWINIDTTSVYELSVTGHTDGNNRYRVLVTCTASGQTDISEEATLIVKENPEVTVNTAELVVCDGESVNLIASGAETYNWHPLTDWTRQTPAVSTLQLQIIRSTL